VPVAALVSAACFCGAALTPRGKLVGDRYSWGRITAVAAVIAWALAELLGRLITEAAPRVTDPHAEQMDPGAVIPIVAAAGVLFVFAGVRLHHRSLREEAQLIDWFGSGLLLLAAGVVDRVLIGPSAGGEITDVVLLRLAGYLVIGVGIVREVQYRQGRAAATITRMEQRRLARTLHDGLCQDLAFLAAHGQRVAMVLGEDNPLAIASRRALATSREALAELIPPADQGLDDALQVLAAELSLRYRISIAVDSGAIGRELSPEDRDDLVKIAHEATINAIKHGHARHVNLLVSDASGPLVMRVQDDGCGIAPADQRHEGFGTTSMREHATSLGGVLTQRLRDGGGTELTVELP
jgi:signal transduction histidine kinase